MSLEATSPPSQPKGPPPAGRPGGFSSGNKRRKHGRQQAGRGGGGGGGGVRKPRKPCCVVCGTDDAKYKCPKCREPYCRVACCKEHKDKCPALSTADDAQKQSAASSSSGGGGGDGGTDAAPPTKRSKYLPSDALAQDPLENAVRRRRMLEEDSDSDDELEPGWRISRDMMDRLDGSTWLRKELADGGLRRIIAEIDTADEAANADRNGRSNSRNYSRGHQGGAAKAQYELSPRELALERAKRDNPTFASFVDRLMLTAGVLKGTSGEAVSIEELLLGDGDVGGLLLAPIEGHNENAGKVEDGGSSSSSDSSDESSSSSSDTESSDE